MPFYPHHQPKQPTHKPTARQNIISKPPSLTPYTANSNTHHHHQSLPQRQTHPVQTQHRTPASDPPHSQTHRTTQQPRAPPPPPPPRARMHACQLTNLGIRRRRAPDGPCRAPRRAARAGLPGAGWLAGCFCGRRLRTAVVSGRGLVGCWRSVGGCGSWAVAGGVGSVFIKDGKVVFCYKRDNVMVMA
jgi:hypothetical protein